MKVYIFLDKNGFYADIVGIYSTYDLANTARINFVEFMLPRFDNHLTHYISDITEKLGRNYYRDPTYFKEETLKSKEQLLLDFLARNYPIIEAELDTKINYSVYCE